MTRPSLFAASYHYLPLSKQSVTRQEFDGSAADVIVEKHSRSVIVSAVQFRHFYPDFVLVGPPCGWALPPQFINPVLQIGHNDMISRPLSISSWGLLNCLGMAIGPGSASTGPAWPVSLPMLLSLLLDFAPPSSYKKRRTTSRGRPAFIHSPIIKMMFKLRLGVRHEYTKQSLSWF